MRTNIVLDDALIAQARKLTGVRSKKEVVNLALFQLVDSYKRQKKSKQDFVETYIENPIKLEDFLPLTRDEIYDR